MPDLMIIGAQKCATTWLWKLLKQHPDLYFPPKKELHYFDRSPEYPSPSLIAQSSPFKRHSRETLYDSIHSIKKKFKSYKELPWFFKYHFGYISEQWYLSLFKGRNDTQLCGEATPAYAILNLTDIKTIHRINPKLKLIYSMRNPIDRDWSALKMKLRKNDITPDEVTDDQIMSYLNGKGCLQKGDYLTAIQNWTTIFGWEQFKFTYLSNIRSQPLRVLTGITEHLGVVPLKNYKKKSLIRASNRGIEFPISEKYYDLLFERHYSKILLLYELLGHQEIKLWLDRKSFSESNC